MLHAAYALVACVLFEFKAENYDGLEWYFPPYDFSSFPCLNK